MYKIKTIFEEVRKGTDSNEYVLGSLLQISSNDEYELYPYLYKKENNSYIFFNMYLEAVDYMLGEKNMVRAYMLEDEFDKYYDNGIDKPFSEVLDWIR